MVSTNQSKVLANDISITPRIRACRFSSATLVRVPAIDETNSLPKAVCADSMGTVRVPIPRFVASSSASTTEWSLEYLDGISTTWTWSAPSASAATVATRAESIPPDRPRLTSVKPLFRT